MLVRFIAATLIGWTGMDILPKVILAIALYLRGWRKNSPALLSAAFLSASAGYGVTMATASAAAFTAAYPGAPPHLTSLAGERISGGSVFFMARAARVPLRAVAGRFFEARKSALAMARLLGAPLLVRYFARRLRVAAVEQRAQAALGVRAGAVRDADPGLAYDVDTLADYRYACARR